MVSLFPNKQVLVGLGNFLKVHPLEKSWGLRTTGDSNPWAKLEVSDANFAKRGIFSSITFGHSYQDKKWFSHVSGP